MSTDDTAVVTPDEMVADLRLAAVSRGLDDKEIALQKQSRVFFQISGAGHEALLLGLARSLRPGHDWFFPYYRDRALMLGLGISPETILLQSVGAATDPASGGRQMPCHWGFPDRHVVSQSSATGSQCLPAIGCAEAGRYLLAHPEIGGDHASVSAQPDEVTYVSLGEGSTSQGEFWESLNTACRLRLPVLYVVADNGWAISVPSRDQQPAPVVDLVRGFHGLEMTRLDGTDYAEVREIGQKALDYLRAGGGPVLLHADVTRPYSHSAADTQAKYRVPEDLEAEKARDPIGRMAQLCVSMGVLGSTGVDAVLTEARGIVEEAAAAALAAPLPDPRDVTRHVVALPEWPRRPTDADSAVGGAAEPVETPRRAIGSEPGETIGAEPAEGAEPVAMADAIRRCLHELMAGDPRIRVFGEDVADAPDEHLERVPGKGGVFGTTLGLQASFGEDRCFNTPLSESNIVGRAIGQALRGLRPFPEVQFYDYIWTAMQQIKTEAATMRWRSNGGFSVPMVLRVPIGGFLTGGAIWHSQSGESIFAHVPGLLVVMPSRAADAVGLLRAAMRCEDPVLFLEHKHLYRQHYARDPYPPLGWEVPFGEGVVRRPGEDVTIVTWGAMVQKSLEAAERVEADGGPAAEVIDLRTIIPWDRQLVADSVGGTGRLLVVHEDIRTAGFGAEIAAWVADECFDDLVAPIRRVAALDTHVGYAPVLEDVILPQVADVEAALRSF
ncbi:MAG TPA: dehydrogenase E1 component subunit alpha/beta [Microthrixaceae bacterium]|nr:dehydrogenase E1 component subunit alpha/beta [Microthrixaceae bacterium]